MSDLKGEYSPHPHEPPSIKTNNPGDQSKTQPSPWPKRSIVFFAVVVGISIILAPFTFGGSFLGMALLVPPVVSWIGMAIGCLGYIASAFWLKHSQNPTIFSFLGSLIGTLLIAASVALSPLTFGISYEVAVAWNWVIASVLVSTPIILGALLHWFQGKENSTSPFLGSDLEKTEPKLDQIEQSIRESIENYLKPQLRPRLTERTNQIEADGVPKDSKMRDSKSRRKNLTPLAPLVIRQRSDSIDSCDNSNLSELVKYTLPIETMIILLPQDKKEGKAFDATIIHKKQPSEIVMSNPTIVELAAWNPSPPTCPELHVLIANCKHLDLFALPIAITDAVIDPKCSLIFENTTLYNQRKFCIKAERLDLLRCVQIHFLNLSPQSVNHALELEARFTSQKHSYIDPWKNLALRTQTAVCIMHQIVLAIASLHEQHIAHRDINPTNALVYAMDEKRAVIAMGDLGGLIPLDGQSGCSKNKDVLPIMTPGYKAPELDKCSDAKYPMLNLKAVDCYALGKTIAKIRELILNDLDPSSDTAKELDQLVGRLTRREPEQRITAQNALHSPIFSGLIHQTRQIRIEGEIVDPKRPDMLLLLPGAIRDIFRLARNQDTWKKREKMLELRRLIDPVFLSQDSKYTHFKEVLKKIEDKIAEHLGPLISRPSRPTYPEEPATSLRPSLSPLAPQSERTFEPENAIHYSHT